MFIKKVKKRNGITKKIYEYLYLVESVRTANGPRQNLILNLGRLDIHPSQYKALARRIEDILTGQQSFIELTETIEKCAQGAAKKIFKKQAHELSESQEVEYQNVNVSSFEAEQCRSIGPEYLCHTIWKELGMEGILTKAGVSEKVIPLLEALVVGRLVEPGSERHTKEWAARRSGIYELAGEPLRRSLKSYYRGGDKLYSLKKELEQHLSQTERTLFSLSEKIVFIDLTNTYFEGKCLKNPGAKRGHSKERRKDCKLATLGLIIDKSGFAKHSQFFPGNQAEGEVLSEMIKSLEANALIASRDKTIVIDAGIATKENIKWLKENKYHYIAVNRGSPPMEMEYSNMKVIREDTSKGIKIEVKRFESDGEIFILCRSKGKVLKERSMRKRVEDLFIERLAYYKAGLAIKRRTKKYKKIVELIGRLREKYPGASKLYNVEVIPEKEKSANDPKLQSTDITWKRKESVYEKKKDNEGCYILRTDRVELDEKEIWEIYVMLTRIENSFKCMKSSLGLRPIFHQKEGRVNTHMFISVLAYHLLHIIEYRLRQSGDHRNWGSIRDILKTHNRLTISYQVKDDNGHIKQQFVRVNSKLEPEHLEIYRKFNLSGVPLPRLKLNNR